MINICGDDSLKFLVFVYWKQYCVSLDIPELRSTVCTVSVFPVTHRQLRALASSVA
jgi:hypothetical protein